jgi:hypothetical protein
MTTNYKNLVESRNRENQRMAEMEQKASPWFWVALTVIVILVMARFEDERTIEQLSAKADRYQRTAEVLAGCMNGQRFSVDGKALSCRVK